MSKYKNIKAKVKKHLVPWRVYGGVVFLPEMQPFLGKDVHIYDGSDNMVLVNENEHVWTYEMLDVEEAPAKTEIIEENETEEEMETK